jgi:hypothetical protein
LKVNHLTVHDGKFTYFDKNPGKPMILSQISLQARNIRNDYSPEGIYPSPFQFNAQVFDKGRIEIEGSANFLAGPHPSVEAEVSLQNIDLSYFRSILSDYHLAVADGWFAAEGQVKYSPQMKTAHLKTARLDGVKIDYIHSAGAAKAEQAAAQKAKEAANAVADRPGLQLRIGELHLTGELGFLNKAQEPPYRLFLKQTDLHLTNLSNQFREGTAEARLTGRFMGSGRTEGIGRFRPERNGPDFDLYLRIVGTQASAMNDLLNAYGEFDVTQGLFSLFSEMRVRNNRVEGYVKPFFENLNVYDPGQDEEKNLFQKMYEGVIDKIADLLKNEASEQVATKADISGRIEDPNANTLQIIANLLRNAFVEIILPGFESGTKPKKKS